MLDLSQNKATWHYALYLYFIKVLNSVEMDTPEMKSRVVRPSSGPGPGGTEMSSMSVMSNNTINTGHHLNNNNSEGVDTVVFHHQPDCHVLAKHKLAAARRPGDPFTTATRWTIFIYRITEQYPLCWDLWHLIDICRSACFFDLEKKSKNWAILIKDIQETFLFPTLFVKGKYRQKDSSS